MAGDPVAELWERVLQIPSIFGRLVYVANLWNQHTSCYDQGLPDRLRTPDVDKAVANWHRAFFTECVALSLEEKQTDVALYWRSTGGDREQLKGIRHAGEAAIPPLVRAEERTLFMQDLALVVALL